MVTALTPNIIEERPMNVAVMDVYSRLMMDRIIFFGYPINDEVANIITAQLLFLDSTDRTRDINMYINSSRRQCVCRFGRVRYHAICLSGCSHYMYWHGCVYGQSLLLAAGTNGKRAALKHAVL